MWGRRSTKEGEPAPDPEPACCKGPLVPWTVSSTCRAGPRCAGWGGNYLEAGSRFEGRFRGAGLEVRQFRVRGRPGRGLDGGGGRHPGGRFRGQGQAGRDRFLVGVAFAAPARPFLPRRSARRSGGGSAAATGAARGRGAGSRGRGDAGRGVRNDQQVRSRGR